MADHRPLVCLDLDGCLVDSRRAITTCLNAAFVEVGLGRSPVGELYELIGPPFETGLTARLARRGEDTALVRPIIDAYRRRYAEASLELTTAVPGIEDALATLAGSYRLVVVTSKATAFAAPIVERLGLDRWVTAVNGTDLDALTETKADTLARILARGPVLAMVGDRRDDIAAGHACGVLTVGVTWGIGDRGELETAGADAVVDTPTELLDVLTTLVCVRSLRNSDIEDILTWRYTGRDAVYDPGAGAVSTERGYQALVRATSGELIGYCCFGEEARVPGLRAEWGVLDIGVGLRPDLVGHGWGQPVARAVMTAGRREHGSERFRVAVLDWNTRSLRTFLRAGFIERHRVDDGSGREFVVLECDAS